MTSKGRTKSIKRILAMLTVLAMMLTVLLPVSPASAYEGTPAVVRGRILTTAETGDASDWVEIAQYSDQSGDYSLIMRTNYISYNGNALYYKGYAYNEPGWNYTPYGASNNYSNSNVRKIINDWFNGVGLNENLPKKARLRDYTVQNNAMYALGTCCNPAKSVYDGLSYPTKYQVGIGNDIAFAPSYSEAANFVSRTYFLRNLLPDPESHPYAKMNYAQLKIPILPNSVHFVWLRSPGERADSAGSIENTQTGVSPGRVFSMSLSSVAGRSDRGMVYPAAWVKSSIFEPDAPPPPPPPTHYTVKYDPNGGNGEVKSFQVEKGNYHIITDVGYTKSGSTLAGWNTERNGNGTPYAVYDFISMVNSDITLYAQWKATSVIIYNPNFDNGSEIIDEGINNNFIIKQNPFTRANYTFKNWNTSSDGSGATLPAGMALNGFRGTLRLYAIWSRVS